MLTMVLSPSLLEALMAEPHEGTHGGLTLVEHFKLHSASLLLHYRVKITLLVSLEIEGGLKV